MGPKRDAMAGRSPSASSLTMAAVANAPPVSEDQRRGDDRPQHEPLPAERGTAQAAARDAQPREQPGCGEGEEPRIRGLEGGEEGLRAPTRELRDEARE